jgi:putative MATE family efflux protein
LRLESQIRKQENYLLTGSIVRGLLSLGIPVILSLLLQTAFNIIDTIWIGRLGDSALAAVSTGGFVLWSVFALAEMVAIGVTAMVARFVGAGDQRQAALFAGQGIWLGVMASIVIGGVGLLVAPGVFAFMGTASDVTQQGIAYLNVLFWGMSSLILFFGLNAIYRGNGDTKTPMKLLFMSVLINGVLDPFLIFGWGPFPALGVVGAAYATVISRLIGVGVGLRILLRRKDWLRWRDFDGRWLNFPMMWRILRIGIPASMAGFVVCVVYIFLTRVTTTFGTPAVAALGAGHRVQSLTYMAGVGVAVAVTTMVGQNLGAKQLERAARTAWTGSAIIALINAAMAVVYFTLSPYIIRIFISDPDVIRIGANYLKVLAIAEIFMGIETVLDGAFGGAGDTVPPTVISVPLTVARYPLAHYFAVVLWNDINGIWVAIALTGFMRGILIMYWFSRGKWKTREV